MSKPMEIAALTTSLAYLLKKLWKKPLFYEKLLYDSILVNDVLDHHDTMSYTDYYNNGTYY
jgi:hypothetical protein